MGKALAKPKDKPNRRDALVDRGFMLAVTLTRDAYERLLAEVKRTGMSIDEVLDEVIARALPHPDDDEGDDG